MKKKQVALFFNFFLGEVMMKSKEIQLIQEFTTAVKEDGTLWISLKRELKIGQSLSSGDESNIRKFVASNVENWIIEHKKPSKLSHDEWRKIVRDSIADPANSVLFDHDLPNLHHFLETQFMKIREILT